MKNRFIILLLSFSILCISIFALPLSIVYATDSYGYTYEEAVDIVNKHNIIYSNEGTPMFIYSSASQLWSAPRYFFTNTYTDKELVDILSSDNVIQYAVTKAKYESISSQLCKALGYATKGASTLITDMVAKDNRQFANGTYSDDYGYSLVADSVDKLREQLKKQYLISIGLQAMYINSYNVCDALNRKTVVDTEDYNDIYNRIVDYDFSLRFANREIIAFNKSDFDYAYFDGNQLRFISHDLKLQDYPFHSLFYSCDKDDCFVTFWKKDNGSYYSCYGGLVNSGGVMWSASYSDFHSKSSDLQFYIFRSYEAVYNYVKGSQTAYVSSKIEETGKDIQISIDDMNTNISDKMDELIDSINNGKGSMSADELQKAIDKGLASLSGKMDDIKDNTQETNNKLDSLLTVMQSQNEILMNILGVTTDIYTVVSSKDDEQDKAYDINYVQAVFNTMFKGLKNAVLYGENTVKQDVNQDTDDVNSLVTDVSPDNVNYRNGLFGKFPFSVPYQLFEWLQVLCVEPVAPSFTLSYDFLLKDFIDEENRDNFKLIIDLNDDKYKEWADLMRSGEKLAFTIYMAIATYNRFKNEV